MSFELTQQMQDDLAKALSANSIGERTLTNQKKLSLKQREHITELENRFLDVMSPKYKAGAIEHQSNIWDMPLEDLLKAINEEVIDAFVYTQTAVDIARKLIKENQVLKQRLEKLSE